ncbi:MAG: hypothetical protein M3214_10320, partial [Actinomycetota bacterium]|nr:hypothetical protein [Actinomycetota bacterium]
AVGSRAGAGATGRRGDHAARAPGVLGRSHAPAVDVLRFHAGRIHALITPLRFDPPSIEGNAMRAFAPSGGHKRRFSSR